MKCALLHPEWARELSFRVEIARGESFSLNRRDSQPLLTPTAVRALLDRDILLRNQLLKIVGVAYMFVRERPRACARSRKHYTQPQCKKRKNREVSVIPYFYDSRE